MNSKTFALITGASSGIGKAIAGELASQKINVLLVDLPDTGLQEVVNNLVQGYGIQAAGIELDLTGPDAALRIHQWCMENQYPVNILVNNAGFGNLCSFEDTDSSLMKLMMKLNNQSIVMLTHQFIPELKKNKCSFILNVGSLASFMPLPNKSVYAATKSFVYAFSSSLRLELKPYNISVSCLCPGGTLTNKSVTERVKSTKLSRMLAQQPEAVAREAVWEMFRGKARIIPGWHNRALYIIRQLLPELCVNWILQQIFNGKNSIREKRNLPSPTYTTASVVAK